MNDLSPQIDFIVVLGNATPGRDGDNVALAHTLSKRCKGEDCLVFFVSIALDDKPGLLVRHGRFAIDLSYHTSLVESSIAVRVVIELYKSKDLTCG